MTPSFTLGHSKANLPITGTKPNGHSTRIFPAVTSQGKSGEKDVLYAVLTQVCFGCQARAMRREVCMHECTCVCSQYAVRAVNQRTITVSEATSPAKWRPGGSYPQANIVSTIEPQETREADLPVWNVGVRMGEGHRDWYVRLDRVAGRVGGCLAYRRFLSFAALLCCPIVLITTI